MVKILLELGTFVSVGEQVTTRLDEACLLIARPGTNYVQCKESGSYDQTNEKLVQTQSEIFQVIFEQIDSLLHSSVYDINEFTQELARHFKYEFDYLIFNIEHMNLSIELTNSIFRAIAHEAIKFAKKQNQLREKLVQFKKVLETADKIIGNIFELAGSDPDANHQKSQFRIPLKPIFDIVSDEIKKNSDLTDLADRVTTAVDTYIDSIYA